MREKLKDHIRAVVDGIKHLSVDDAADLIAEIADDENDCLPPALFQRGEAMMNAAILDGLRWGYAAAVYVEMAGGAMVRFIMPGGSTITNEWEEEADADQPIKDALAAIHEARSADRATAAGVGEDEA